MEEVAVAVVAGKLGLERGLEVEGRGGGLQLGVHVVGAAHGGHVVAVVKAIEAIEAVMAVVVALLVVVVAQDVLVGDTHGWLRSEQSERGGSVRGGSRSRRW